MSAPLAGMRVVDFVGGLAAGYCTKQFNDAGADVVLVEPPDGDPMRRWRIGDEPSDGDSPLFRYLRHGQSSLLASDPTVLDHLARADLVLTDLHGPDPEKLRSEHPGLVVLSITPYGRTGPYRDRPVTEFTMQCDVGSTAGRGLLWQEPFHAGGRTGEWFAGVAAATAAIAALRRQARTGHGELIDLAVAEAINLAMTMFSDLQADLLERPEGFVPRTQETPSIEPTLDGYVGFNTNTRQQLGDFCLMIGAPEEADRFSTARDRVKEWDDWTALVHRYTTTHTTAEIIEFASALRIPVAPVCNGETVQTIDHFVDRGVFIDDPTGEFRMPRRPWRLDHEPLPSPEPAPTTGAGARPWQPRVRPEPTEPADLPLAGVRIVDATAWWAGPTCTTFLAALGAEVIHIESCKRPDGMRMIGGYFQDEPQWWEWSFVFASANTNKAGLTLDLATERGRELFLDLVSQSDVLVENYTPRVFDNFGFDEATLTAANPGLIFARMPAFGLDGPWRDRPGFAQTMEQVTGLAWVTGHRDDQPRIQKGPCDPNAGLHASFAIIAALMRRDVTGQGAHIEATMAEAALCVAAEQVIEHSAHGTLMERGGNRSPYATPQGIYATDADESWVGLAVTDDTEWAALAAVIGCPHLLELSAAERQARHDEIDELIAAWAVGRTDAAAADELLAAGIPAAVVRNPHHTHRHPQFSHRGYLEQIDHPVLGTRNIAGLPFRYASVERWLRAPAPTLGQDNHRVLAGLGLSPDEIAGLEADGIIGDRLEGA